MADDEEDKNVEEEYKWLLSEELPSLLKNLQSVVLECCRRFPMPATSNEDNLVRPDKLILSNSNGMKCLATLLGDNICDAELTVKIQKSHTVSQIHKTSIQADFPWKLQQLQDAGNYLCHALAYIRSRSDKLKFRSGQEATMLLDDIIESLNKGRSCLAVPKRKSVDEIIKNRYMRCFRPPLPVDCSVSFYIHAQKLVLAVYQLQITAAKIEIISRNQMEVAVPWFDDVIVLFTVALQMCQQMRDKIITVGQCRSSTSMYMETSGEAQV